MSLSIHPEEAKRLGMNAGQRIIAFNELGEVAFILKITEKVPRNVAVADGIAWLCDAPGERTINALTSQRFTDRGHGSTFYDAKVDLRAE